MVLSKGSLLQSSNDRDDASAEITAINAINKALSALTDPDARVRVLRWANERFNPSVALDDAHTSPAAAPREASADAMLSIDGLHGLFDQPARQYEVHDAPYDMVADDMDDLFDAPVVRARAELRVVARNDAAPKTVAHELSDLYETPAARHHDVPESIADVFDDPAIAPFAGAEVLVAAPFEHDSVAADALVEDALALEDTPPVQAQAAPDQPLDTLVADFATAIRLLTAQFEDATT